MNCRQMFQIGRLASVLLALGLGLLRTEAVPSADGLCATFFIKRNGATLGDFTCSLNYQLAPRTVANFVGLATGSRGWMDFKKGGLSHKPFYDGITFHRVVAGFVIQAGSPNGQGTDGPGYTFKDEFNANLRHNKVGILSMANSGINSNGSQFFITLAQTSFLDDVHSVFGEVVENLSIMQSVQQGDVIDHVTITRIGTAAQAFDVDAQNLPGVQDALPSLAKNGSAFSLNYTQSDDAEYFTFHSGNLTTWSQITGQELYIAPPSQTAKDVTSQSTGQSQHYFTVTKVQYPEPLLTPVNMVGKKIVITDPTGFTFTWNLSTATTGTYSTSLASGTYPIIAYSWTQEAYRGRMFGSISGLSFSGGEAITQVNISFSFTSATSGACKGSIIGQFGNQFNMAGPFTVTAIP